jgi:multiple sugar transport system substrate-binding protein
MSGHVSRRIMLKAMGAGVLGALAAACGGTPEPTPTARIVEKEVTKVVEKPVTQVVDRPVTQVVERVITPTPLPVKKVAIRYSMYTGTWDDIIEKELLPAFSKDYPNITVTYEKAPIDQYWPRIETQAAAGIAPDTFCGGPTYNARYASKGIYLALEEFIKRDALKLTDYFPVGIETCRYEQASGVVGKGVLYGLPIAFMCSVLYYNKDLFDAAKVPYPTNKWTKEDLLSAGLKLTTDKNGKHPGESGFDPANIKVYGAVKMHFKTQLVNFLWNNGAEIISPDGKECWLTKPEAIEALQFVGDCITKHYICGAPAFYSATPNNFQDQQVAMRIEGSWQFDYYCETATKFKWDVIDVPLGNKSLPRVAYGDCDTNHVYAQTKLQEEAWSLLKWMSGPKGLAIYQKIGLPPLTSAAEEAVKKACPPNRRLALDAGRYTRTYYNNLWNDEWKTIYHAELDALWLGKATAAQVAKTVSDKITPILQRKI